MKLMNNGMDVHMVASREGNRMVPLGDPLGALPLMQQHVA
jgi:hypothetical protein